MSRCSRSRCLEASYGQTQALFGLDFGVEEGGITTLLGANGAGKTTTLRAHLRHVRTDGEIRFDGKADRRPRDRGHRAARHRARARGPRHLPAPDGRGEPALGAMPRPARHRGRPRARLRLLPVPEERPAQQAGTLSGGEQQMLAVGRA